jgi:DNA-binding ferritin-like protein (Dps family)
MDEASGTSDHGRARPETDEVLAALADLLAAAEQVEESVQILRKRAALLETARAAGVPYRELVGEEHRPLIAELLTDTIKRFEAAGTRFRQAQALALHREGMTLSQVARLFGLTRQRISTLLRTLPPGREGRG